MQFATAFAAIVALATSASAATLKTRQEPLATLEAYNYSTCDVESVATIDIVDQACHNFEQGYGNAQATLANPDENCMCKFFFFFFFSFFHLLFQPVLYLSSAGLLVIK